MFRTIENTCRALLDPEKRGFRGKTLLVFLAISGTLMAAVLLLGPYPITKFPLDTAYFLAQGDYLLKGFRPYVDYNSMHGPFTFLFSAAGMIFHGVSLHAVILAQVLGATVFGLLMFKIAVSRVHAFWAILLAVSVELILLSSSPIGHKAWREFTCAMWYNTLGYAMQSIIFLYLLVPSGSTSKVSRWLDSGIMAFCLAACLLTKMSFFMPTAILFFIGAILWPREPGMRWQGVVAFLAAGVIAVAIMGMLGGSLVAYFEYLDTLLFRANPLLLLLRFVQFSRTIGIFLLGMLLVSWMAHEAGLIKQLWREWILALLMLGTQMVSVSTAAQDQEILPTLGVVTLGITVLIGAIALREGRSINFHLAVPSLLISLMLVVYAPKNGALSVAFSHLSVPQFTEPVERLSQTEIDAMQLDLPPRVDQTLFTMMPKSWVDRQLAAIRLLDAAATDDRKAIFVATSTSPIALLTDYQNALGQSAWWPHVFAPKPEDVPLSDDKLLEDADWILRDLEDGLCWDYLRHHRGQYIDDHFELVAENEHWQLYGRKASGSSLKIRPTNLD